MEMENRNRNFMSLKAEFHDKGSAFRGYNNIINFIEKEKKEELKHLLRFHDPIGVYGQELIERFEIDALMQYYNLLLVAIFSGYIPERLDEKTIKEIILVLNHPSVIPYYETYYKDEILSYTLQFAKENRIFKQEGNSVTISAFNEFISLNRLLKSDKDIERFLGMLDYVWYQDNTINEVNEILSSHTQLTQTFTTKEKSEADRGVWGFIKFAVFLSQLKELLLSIDEYPLLQSSLWMFHGYYFSRMNAKMKLIFNEAFINLERTLSNPEIFKNIIEETYKGGLPEGFNEDQLVEFAKTAIVQSREDVDFILDTRWSFPLKEYFQINARQDEEINLNELTKSVNSSKTTSTKIKEKILFLASNPSDTSRLRIDKEARDIGEGLRRANKRDTFDFEVKLATRPRDLLRAILDENPQILHFSGHGEVEGILLEDENGTSKVVTTEALSALFSLFRDTIKCVILNSCYSESQAKEISKHIPFVIGMSRAVPDNTAIAFATSFYDAIAAGREIKFAFKFAITNIELEGLTGNQIPVLLNKE